MSFFDVNTSGTAGRTRLNFAGFLITPALGWIWVVNKLTRTDLRYVHGTDVAIAQYETVRISEQRNAIMLKQFVEYLGRSIREMQIDDNTTVGVLNAEFAATARKFAEIVRADMVRHDIPPATRFADSEPSTESL